MTFRAVLPHLVGSIVSYHLEKSGQAQVTTVSRSKLDAGRQGIRIESDEKHTSIGEQGPLLEVAVHANH